MQMIFLVLNNKYKQFEVNILSFIYMPYPKKITVSTLKLQQLGLQLYSLSIHYQFSHELITCLVYKMSKNCEI